MQASGILHKSNGIWERKCKVLYGVLIYERNELIELWIEIPSIWYNFNEFLELSDDEKREKEINFIVQTVRAEGVAIEMFFLGSVRRHNPL